MGAVILESLDMPRYDYEFDKILKDYPVSKDILSEFSNGHVFFNHFLRMEVTLFVLSHI